MLRMSVSRISSLIAAAALMGAAAGAAQAAEPKARPLDLSIRQEPSPITSTGGKTMKFDASKGRWGLTLNMEQPDARPSTLNDVQAGAYYRITPTLRVGGAVALGDEQVQPGPKKLSPDEGQPRVRFGTIFKF
jgi:hypothetical protein